MELTRVAEAVKPMRTTKNSPSEQVVVKARNQKEPPIQNTASMP